MSRLDVLLVKPGNQKKIYEKLSSFNLTALEPPFWATLLSGYLRGLGYSVEILDQEVEQWNNEKTVQNIIELNPILTVISVSGSNPSASTMNMNGSESLLRRLKLASPLTKTILHGLHPSALPERTLLECAVDFVCQGEGFYTLPEIIDALKANETIFNIEGLWYKKDGIIKSNPRPPIFKNLDELPMPAWDLLSMEKYRAHNWHCFGDIRNRQPYGVLYTSLGCPYNCTFCCINEMFGKPGLRNRSSQAIIQEIDLLVSTYGIRNFKIVDELFAFKEERVIEICDLIIERDYDLNMWAYARVNSVTPAMLEKMKLAGINWVAYGFESGNKRIIRKVNKRYDLNTIKNVVKMTYDAGLYIGANFLFGLPGDDFDSMQDTLTLANEINAEWANFNPTMAYPGSLLYKEALEKGWMLPDTWQGYSQYSRECFPMSTRYLTSSEVLAFRDYAFSVYYENPRYLDKINRLFGIETVRHIQEMTKHKLIRKHKQFRS